MSPKAQVQQSVGLESMDATPDGTEDGLTLHDLLAGPGEDPAARVCRATDWNDLLEGVSGKRRDLVYSLAEGRTGRETAGKLNVSAPRIVQLKRELASDIKDEWGEGIANEVGKKPSWMNGIIAEREKRAYRYEMKTV